MSIVLKLVVGFGRRVRRFICCVVFFEVCFILGWLEIFIFGCYRNFLDIFWVFGFLVFWWAALGSCRVSVFIRSVLSVFCLFLWVVYSGFCFYIVFG